MKKAKSSRRTKKKAQKVFLQAFNVAILFLVVIILFVSIAMLNKRDDKVPKMYINLNGVSFEELSENGKDIVYSGNEVLLESSDGIKKIENVEIKGRGNTTWGFDKKPLRIDFKKKTDVLGLGEIKRWNLLANYIDDSELRNDLAFKLAEVLEMDYASRGTFVDVYINGEPMGLYYITTPIKLGKETINLSEAGAILVELDDAYCEYEDQTFITSDNNCLVLKDVRNKDRQEQGLEDFGKQFEKFEKAVRKGDFETIKEVIDVESFAKYFLLNEFAGNPDGFFTSFFMYKNGDDDLIYAGPVWDFDAAFGNKVWWGEEVDAEQYSPQKFLIRREVAFSGEEDDEKKSNTRKISKLMFSLIDIPEFQEVVRKVYNEKLYKNEDYILNYIKETADYIKDSAIADNKMWQKNGFEEEIDYLTWWVGQRFIVFEKILGNRIELPKYIDEM